MSTQETVFPIYQIIDFIFDTDLTSSEKLLLIGLLRFYNRKTGKCFPSLDTLNMTTSLNKKTIQANVEKLIAKGMIQVIKGGYTKPNHYTLLFIEWCKITPLTGTTTPTLTGTTTPTLTGTTTPTEPREGKEGKERIYSTEIKNFCDTYMNFIIQKKKNRAPKYTPVLFKNSCSVVDKLIRLDDFSLQYIQDALRWAYKDEFWSDQVLSLAQLRKTTKGDSLTKFQKISNQYDKYIKPHDHRDAYIEQIKAYADEQERKTQNGNS